MHDKLGNPASAIISYEAAIKLSPDDPKLHTAIAVIFMKTKRGDRAADHLNSALAADPSYEAAWYNYAVYHEKVSGAPRKAISYYKRFADLSKDEQKVLKAKQSIVRLSATLQQREPEPEPEPTPEPEPEPSPEPEPAPEPEPEPAPEPEPSPEPEPTPEPEPAPEPDAAQLLAEAKRQNQTGNMEQALILVKRVLSENPAHADGLWLYANLLEKSDAKAAITTYRAFMKAARTDSRVPHAQLRIQALRAQPTTSAAISTPTRQPTRIITSNAPPTNIIVRERTPTTPDRDDFGRAKTGQTSSSGARQAFEQASAQERAGNIENAILNYQKAVRLDPDFGVAYYNLGILQKRVKRYKAAETSLLHALRIDPGMLKARYMLAMVYWSRGNNYNSALDHLNLVIERDPSYTKAYYLKALIYNRTRNDQKALETAQALIKVAPNHADAYFLAGLSTIQLRRPSSETRPYYTLPLS